MNHVNGALAIQLLQTNEGILRTEGLLKSPANDGEPA